MTIKHRMCFPSNYVEGYFKWSLPPAKGRQCVMLFLEMIGIALPGFITLMSLQEQQNQSRSILISFF